MVTKLNTPVSVLLGFDHKRRSVMPRRVMYEGREHTIQKLGYHHTYRSGRTLMHVFSVSSATMYFRLVLDTDTLFWTLEEIHDGEISWPTI